MVKKNDKDEPTPAIERVKQTRKDLQEPEECEIIEKKARKPKPKTQKQLDALKLGRERRKQNLLNKQRPKEVLEDIEEEPKTEHKVKSRGITKKPRRKQKIIIESSSEDESSSSEDEIIVKRVSRRSKNKPKAAEPSIKEVAEEPSPPKKEVRPQSRAPPGQVNKLLLMRSMGF